MALRSTHAAFDPLSFGGTDESDGAFTTVFEGGPPAAAAAPAQQPAAPDPAAAAAAGDGLNAPGGGADDDSFMTAASGSHMSYAAPPPTASYGSSGGGAAGGGGLFRRLPDHVPQQRAAAGDAINPFAPPPSPPPPPAQHAAAPDAPNPFAPSSSPPVNPFAPAPVPPPAAATRGPTDPFAAYANPFAPAPGGGAGGGGGGALGPLEFGGGGNSGSNARDDGANFIMPVDLYDTPDSFPLGSGGGGAGGGGSQPARAPPQLPPLYDFTRELSTAQPLPVSGGTLSPQSTYDNGANATAHAGAGSMSASPGGGGAAASDFGGPSTSAGGGGGLLAPYGSSPTGGGGGYAAAALMSNTVTVHSPRKAVAPTRIPGISEPYVSYSVSSRGAALGEACVERRFRDVVALTELLQALYPGCFVPARPSRNAIEGRRMQAGFVEERRLGLEKFLRRLVAHPVLGPCEATQVWLRCPAPDLRSAPEWRRLQPEAPPGLAASTAKLLAQVVGRERTVPTPADVLRPASAASGQLYRVVHERTAQMRGVLANTQLTAAEERLRHEAAALQERCDALLKLSRGAEALVAKGGKVASVTAKLGEALGKVAAAEEEAASGKQGGGKQGAGGGGGEGVGGGMGRAAGAMAGALGTAAEGCGKVGKLLALANEASARHLAPVNDWLAEQPCALAALASRERCLLTVATLERDLAAGRSRVLEAAGRQAAAGGNNLAAARKVDAARAEVGALEAALAAARSEYERVAGRNATDLQAAKVAMSHELAAAIREVALLQQAAAQRAHAVWGAAAEALGEAAVAARAVAAMRAA